MIFLLLKILVSCFCFEKSKNSILLLDGSILAFNFSQLRTFCKENGSLSQRNTSNVFFINPLESNSIFSRQTTMLTKFIQRGGFDGIGPWVLHWQHVVGYELLWMHAGILDGGRKRGWGSDQFFCFKILVYQESGSKRNVSFGKLAVCPSPESWICACPLFHKMSSYGWIHDGIYPGFYRASLRLCPPAETEWTRSHTKVVDTLRAHPEVSSANLGDTMRTFTDNGKSFLVGVSWLLVWVGRGALEKLQDTCGILRAGFVWNTQKVLNHTKPCGCQTAATTQKNMGNTQPQKAWLKDETSCKFSAVTCPPGNEWIIRFEKRTNGLVTGLNKVTSSPRLHDAHHASPTQNLRHCAAFSRSEEALLLRFVVKRWKNCLFALAQSQFLAYLWWERPRHSALQD